MSSFSTLNVYATKWMVKNVRNFTAEEQSLVNEAVVVPSQYGNSVCFMMKAGGQTFIPLSTTSSKTVGESINLSTAKIVTLGKPGEADILRIEA